MKFSKGFSEFVNRRKIFYPACDYPYTKKYFVKLPKTRLWIEEEGNGYPIVLLHGGPGGNHSYFHPYLSLLAKKYKLIYYDMRGHYMSSLSKDNKYGVLEDVYDLENLRKALKLNKVSLLGHSYGGIVAFEYALNYQENISHLILVSVPILWTEKDRERLYNTNNLHIKFEKMWNKCKTEEERIRLYYKWNYYRKINPLAKKYIEISRRAYLTNKNTKIMQIYSKDKYEPDWYKLNQIKIPVLVLFGRHDPDIKPDKAFKLLNSLKNITTVIFSRSKHDIFVDEPKKFYSIVNKFLSL
jgi:proline iminopeptidase